MSAFPAIQTNTAERVRQLAREHGVTAKRTGADAMADVTARLAGDEPSRDEIHDLLINLARAGVLSDDESMDLFVSYQKER